MSLSGIVYCKCLCTFCLFFVVVPLYIWVLFTVIFIIKLRCCNTTFDLLRLTSLPSVRTPYNCLKQNVISPKKVNSCYSHPSSTKEPNCCIQLASMPDLVQVLQGYSDWFILPLVRVLELHTSFVYLWFCFYVCTEEHTTFPHLDKEVIILT